MATTITAGNSTNGAAISSDNTGILELKTGTGSGTTALTLSTAQAATFAGAVTSSGLITGATGALYPIVSGTAVAASGTSVDFTGIPSWAKRITVMFSEVSTNGTSNLQLQIGSGSVTTSGYSAVVQFSSTSLSVTTGFGLASAVTSASLSNGVIVVCLVGSNTYASSGNIASITGGGSVVYVSGGAIALSGVLDRVRITTVNGTDTFDAGTINILYE